MSPHSSTLAWKIPWTEEPGGLQSMGSLRVGHDWATSLSLFTFMHWRRKWQPTPVFLPGASQGRRSLVGCRLCGCTELDTTEATQQQQQRGMECYLRFWHSRSPRCIESTWRFNSMCLKTWVLWADRNERKARSLKKFYIWGFLFFFFLISSDLLVIQKHVI